MIVYFLRHANAGTKRANPAADEKRPLDAEGITQCRYMGRTLAAEGFRDSHLYSATRDRAVSR